MLTVREMEMSDQRRTAIVGGGVCDPSLGIHEEERTVLISDGKLEDLPKASDPIGEDWKKLDASGLIIVPGFIDLHAHLREPGEEWKETIETGTAAAARGGFTSVCAMPNTNPTIDSVSALKLFKTLCRSSSVNIYPIAAATVGRNGSTISHMAALAEEGAVAFSDDGNPIVDTETMRGVLAYSRVLDLPIVNHAENPSLVAGGVLNEGVASVRLGLQGSPSVAEAVMVARDVSLATYENARLHVPHISASLSLDILRTAKDKGCTVTGEVTPHHLMMTEDWAYGEMGKIPPYLREEAYDSNVRVNPPVRSEKDRRALQIALSEGLIDAVATDHAPHGILEKELPFAEAAPGINGFETAFGLCMSLVHSGVLTLSILIDRMSCAPAKIFRIPGGTLKKGSQADLILLSPDEEWEVRPEQFASRSVNTPFAGMKLRGKVIMTFVKGVVVHDARAGGK